LEWFTPGGIFLGLIVMLVASGIAILTRDSMSDPDRAHEQDLLVWLFTPALADVLNDASQGPSLVQIASRRLKKRVRVELLGSRAIDTRLLSITRSDSSAAPQLVALEINSAAKFLKPDHSGRWPLHPLDPYLDHQSRSRLIDARVKLWSSQNQAFGVPLDVHPVGVVYRKDLFDRAGVDLASSRTWEQFHSNCLEYQSHFNDGRSAFELRRSGSDQIIRMVLQRGVNLVDETRAPHLADPRVLNTVLTYASMVAGKRRVGADSSPGATHWVNDLRNGSIASFMVADWRLAELRRVAGYELLSKLRVMPLPTFEPTDKSTSTWGGTMIGIPRGVSDPKIAWELLEILFLSDQAIQRRERLTGIVSPVVLVPKEAAGLVKSDTLKSQSLASRSTTPTPARRISVDYAPGSIEQSASPVTAFDIDSAFDLFQSMKSDVPSVTATSLSSTASGLLSRVVHNQALRLERGINVDTAAMLTLDELTNADIYLRRVAAFEDGR